MSTKLASRPQQPHGPSFIVLDGTTLELDTRDARPVSSCSLRHSFGTTTPNRMTRIFSIAPHVVASRDDMRC